ncbi:Nif3-like dinuclear metal center hexameric protein [Weissella tructae]
MQANELIQKIEEHAPKHLAWERDAIGIQIGDGTQEIHRVMTTLDVLPEVVEEAIAKGVDFIFAHHPVMFRPAKNLDLSDPQNQMYAKLIKHDIVVYAAHTNLDAAKDGLNDWLADAFTIKNVKPLLANPDGETGLGRIGTLAEPMTVANYAAFIRDVCGVEKVRVIANDTDRLIKTVAVLGGDGGKEYAVAQAQGADAYVTADIYYHVGHSILMDDFVVIDPDHHMEALATKEMAKLVQTWQSQYNWELYNIFVSTVNTDPYQYI